MQRAAIIGNTSNPSSKTPEMQHISEKRQVAVSYFSGLLTTQQSTQKHKVTNKKNFQAGDTISPETACKLVNTASGKLTKMNNAGISKTKKKTLTLFHTPQ